tara:strand:+ start:1790 stop:2869 length:1080 start_codon:yes stop_codon:yes gene_type:complete
LKYASRHYDGITYFRSFFVFIGKFFGVYKEMKKNTEKILKKGYQGTAKLGQAASSIGFVIAVIFGIVLIAGGIALFVVKVPQDPDSPVQEKPEWKQDEIAILKDDESSSYSHGDGRFANQIIRNLAMAIIAEKFDLFIRYQRSQEIEKLGFKLFCGTKKYSKNKVVTEKNYYYILKYNTLHYNIRSRGKSFYQTKQITNDIHNYLKSSKIMDQIVNNNIHKERYKNNNDCFIHIRLGDVADWNPGFAFYYKIISNINFNKLYIATDSPDHSIIAQLRNRFPHLDLYDTNLPDIMLFASTCKHVILSYGSFSAVIGYLSYYSNVYYKKVTNKTAWDFNSGDNNNMFNEKSSKIGKWIEIE